MKTTIFIICFVFTVLFSKYFEVHVELCGTRKFMFRKVGRDLKKFGNHWFKQYCPDKTFKLIDLRIPGYLDWLIEQVTVSCMVD